jgi:hypothetical protein
MNEEINVYGLRRSGNHIIIEWLLSHFDSGILINNYNHTKYKNIYHYNNSKICKINNYKNINSDMIIKSHEDICPDKINKNDILILRDWYNVCASRYISKRGWENSCDNNSCADVYLKFCKLYDKYSENFILYNFIVDDNEYIKTIEKKIRI